MKIMKALLLLMVVVTVSEGCSRVKYPKAYPVSGTLKYKGSPLEGATVTLVPSDPAGKSGSGVTDSAGNFTVTTYMAPDHMPKGALAGDYKVTVSKFDKAPVVEMEDSQALYEAQRNVKKPKSLIPIRFSNPVNSGLSYTVKTSGGEPLNIEIDE